MTTILVILACVVIVGILAVFYEIRKLRKARDSELEGNNGVLMEWLKEMREDQRHSSQASQEATRQIGERLDNAAKVIGTLNQEVGRMQKMGQSIEEMQQVFRSPKLRGNVGESLMKDILKECLPKTKFKLQYGFKSGEKVDAVVLTSSGLIPIDSKFPLEKFLAAQKADEAEKEALLKEFQKQVKKHIDDIAKKYILPGEQTVDYAFMYVPGEAVFQEIYNTSDLFDYAAGRHVILVSPNNFYLFLQLVLKSLEGEQIEEKAKQVLVELRSIHKDSDKLGANLGVLHKHLNNARNTIDSVHKDYGNLSGKLEQAGRLSGTAKPSDVKKQLEGMAELPDEPVTEPVKKR